MQENSNQETAAKVLYKARKEVMQTGTERMNNTEVKVMGVVKKWNRRSEESMERKNTDDEPGGRKRANHRHTPNKEHHMIRMIGGKSNLENYVVYKTLGDSNWFEPIMEEVKELVKDNGIENQILKWKLKKIKEKCIWCRRYRKEELSISEERNVMKITKSKGELNSSRDLIGTVTEFPKMLMTMIGVSSDFL